MHRRKTWNLYNDRDIASLKHVFNIRNLEDMEELWLFFQEKEYLENDKAFFMIHESLYNYTDAFLEDTDNYDIVIEHAKGLQYLTLWHQDHQELLKEAYKEFKVCTHVDMRIDAERATFKIDLGEAEGMKEEELVITEQAPTEIDGEVIIEPAVTIPEKKELIIYDFLSQDDLMNMREINDELLNQMFYISSAQIDEDKLGTIIQELDTYNAIFAKYDELREISDAVSSFRDVLEDHMMEIIQNTNRDLNLFFEGIISNLRNWTEMSFEKGIEDINYFNASILSDISMIKQFLNVADESAPVDDDFDDIFF